jgi:serine/threonine-protein kinase
LSSPHANSTISNDLLPLLIASFPNVRDLALVVEAALTQATLTLDVDETPQPEMRYALELTCPGYDQQLAVLAELAGPREDAGFPLALRPLGRQGEAALRAFLSEHASHAASEPPVDDPLRGRLLGGAKYEIESEISSGAIGRVYRGRHRLLNRPIAVKLLHEDLAGNAQFVEHFNGEARAASRLDHPNICRVFDFGEDDDGLRYIVMELLEGIELGHLVAEEGPLPLERVVDFGSQICAALSAAHERGIVHRDVKAENIVAVASVDDDGLPTRVLKVCDFGLAMSLDVSSDEQFGTFRGTCGTPAYMPPEQVLGETLDARADVYACGVLLYLLATGKLPFDSPDVQALLRMQLHDAPAPPSTVNPAIEPGLEAVILRAMCKDRLGRFATARELRAALRSLVHRSEAPHSSPGGAAPPPSLRSSELAARGGLAAEGPATEHGPLIDSLTRAVLGAETPELSRLLAEVLARRPFRLFRADPTTPTLLLDDGVREPFALSSAAPGPRATLLETTLAQRGVVLLSAHAGLTKEGLSAVVQALSRPLAPTLSRPHLTLLTDDSRLGQRRPLPWPVDLVASEVTFVLAKVLPENVRRSELVAALGPIRQASDAKTLLETTDLIGGATQRPAWDVACAIGAGLAQPVCMRLLALLADDVVRRNLPVPPDLLLMLAKRLSADRSPESDDLLQRLAAIRLLPVEGASSPPADEGPSAQQLAQQLAFAALADLEAAKDDATYFASLTILEEAMVLLMNQGRLTPFAHGIRVLARHAKDLTHPFRAPIAARALAGLQDPAFLERVALVLLRGAGASQEAAQSVILSTGAVGARALCNARCREGAALDMGARKRFVVTVKLMGAVADSEVERMLRQAGSEALEVFVVEDCLRALREGASDNATAAVMRLTEHFAPQVRRAALGAMMATLGPRVGPLLTRALHDPDERVRLTALIGLQRVENLDEAAVALLEEQLALGDEDARAAAAAALRNAAASARPRAIAALTKALSRAKTSLTFRLGADKPDTEGFGVVAAATSLYALDPVQGRRVIEARAQRADGPLRRRLLDLLRR